MNGHIILVHDEQELLLVAAAMAAVTALPYAAQSRSIPDINDKIRKEEADNSQVMKTLHYLADVYGPRVTGSPNHKAAAEWAVKTMTSWGMQNGHLEPWDFGLPGLGQRAPRRSTRLPRSRTRSSSRRWRGRRAPTAPSRRRPST